MQRNATAARDADAYRPELIADEEPRYLRRQKPVEIRRKKFSGRGWPFYRHLLVLSLSGIVGATAAYYGAQLLLYSPSMLLLKPDQIEVTGNHIVSREAVLQQFVHGRTRSVLRIPLESRRGQLEQIPWVESASVQRILPNRLRIELTERIPIAFARNGNELGLIDAHGVILDRPRGEELHFPIVTGVSEDLQIFAPRAVEDRSEEHTSELQSLAYLVCRLLLEKNKKTCVRFDHPLRPSPFIQ